MFLSRSTIFFLFAALALANPSLGIAQSLGEKKRPPEAKPDQAAVTADCEQIKKNLNAAEANYNKAEEKRRDCYRKRKFQADGATPADPQECSTEQTAKDKADKNLSQVKSAFLINQNKCHFEDNTNHGPDVQ